MKNAQTIDLEFEQVHDREAFPYEILLLADETIQAINQYIFESAVYIVKSNGRAVGAFCLLPIDKETIELKNIAVVKEFQGEGIGSRIINFIKEICKVSYTGIIAGTPDCAASQIRFYKRNGFSQHSIRKDFYILHYDEPIYENGIQLRDMLLLKYGFNDHQ
jgi:GNAT superfamily N-acetyltransferase